MTAICAQDKIWYIKAMKRLVLYFHSSATAQSQQKVLGACRAIQRRGWTVLRFDILSPSHIRETISYWQPDGCIVDAVTIGTETIGNRAFSKQPTVFIDCNPLFTRRRVNTLVQNTTSIADAAAQELLRRNPSSCAYVSWPGRPFWSETRGKAFVKAVKRHASTSGWAKPPEIRVFNPEHIFKDRRSLIGSLAEWMRTLPLPAGIFSATDAMSGQVLESTTLLGLNVPEDIMIIGTDNEEFFCENVHPMLSSVSQDFIAAGEKAVDMLETLIDAPCTAPIHETFNKVSIVSRASTRRSIKHDHAVTAALDMIRKRATAGIKAAEVLACFSCSRRLAEKRFKEAAGCSVTEEIHAVQIEHAKEFALNPLTKLTAIPEMCGHPSAPYFQRLFKKKVGCSMEEYRTLSRKHHFRP